MKLERIIVDTDIKTYNVIDIMQYYSLILQVDFLKNGNTFIISEYDISIEMLKGDNTFIIQNDNYEIIKNEKGDLSSLRIICNNDLTRINGNGKLQIKLINKENIITGSWIIDINILKSAISEGDIPSKNLITTLEELRNEIKNADEQKNILVNTIETEKNSVENLIQDVNKNIADANVIPTKEYSSYFKNITTTNYINDTLDCRNGYFKNVGIKGNTLVNYGGSFKNVTFDKTINPDFYKKNIISQANGLIPKLDTTYTIITDIKTMTAPFLKLDITYDSGEHFYFNISSTKGFIKNKITFDKNVKQIDVYIDNSGVLDQGKVCYINSCMILEGDWTNKQEPSYFEGIKSIGELSPIKIISNNINMANLDYDNIISKTVQEVNITGNNINIKDNGGAYHRAGFNLNLKKNTKYIIKGKKLNNFNDENSYISIRNKSNDVALLKNIPENEFNFIFNIGDLSEILLCFYSNGGIVEKKDVTWGDIQIIEETKNQEFIPSQRYYLELENIVLPGLPNGICDIYDKNNKIIRNVDKLVFNGSENWVKDDSIETQFEQTILFKYYTNKSQQTENGSNIISDKFSNRYIWNLDIEGIFINKTGAICIRILKSKLETQDLSGFKKWLSQNNVVAYYQKAVPTFEDIKENKSLQCFADGIVTFEDTFYPNLGLTYPATFNSAILTNAIELNNFNNIIEENVNIISKNTTNISKNTTDITTNKNNISKNTTDINKNISSINSLNTNLTNTINSFSISQSGTDTTLKMANNVKVIYYSDFFHIDSGQYPYGRDIKFETAFPNGLIGISICGRRMGSDIFGLKNSEIWNKTKEGFSFTGTMESGKVYAIEVMAIGY